MRLHNEQLGVIVVGKDDVFTPPFASKQPGIRYSLFAADDDPSAVFSAREADKSDDLRLQMELSAWDAASDEALMALDI